MTRPVARSDVHDSRIPDRRVLTILVGIFIVHVITLRSGQPWWDDFALYLLHARNLVEGLPYGETGYLYNPLNSFHSPAAYPPGLPLIIVPVYALLGPDLYAIRIVLLGLFVIGLLFFYWLIRSKQGDRLALLATMLLGLQPFVLWFKNLLLPDLPFLLFALLSLYLVEKIAESRRGVWMELLIGLAAGLTMFLAASLRSAGISLLGAVVLAGVASHRYRRAGILAACILMLALLLLQTAWMPDEPGYVAQLAGSVSNRSFLSVLAVRARHVRELFVATEPLWHSSIRPLTLILMFSTALLSIVGFGSRVRSISTFETFVVAYVGILFIWPFVQTRYLIPLLPLIIHYSIMGMAATATYFPRFARSLALILGVTAAAVYAENLVRVDRSAYAEGPAAAEAAELFAYLRQCTPREARTTFARPRALALYTRRAAMVPPNRLEDIVEFVARDNIDYVVAFRAGLLDNLAKAKPDTFQAAFRNGEFVVYRVSLARGQVLREAANYQNGPVPTSAAVGVACLGGVVDDTVGRRVGTQVGS